MEKHKAVKMVANLIGSWRFAKKVS